MSQILHNHDFRLKIIYNRKSINLSKLNLQQIVIISKLYNKIHNNRKKYPIKTLNTLLKLKFNIGPAGCRLQAQALPDEAPPIG